MTCSVKADVTLRAFRCGVRSDEFACGDDAQPPTSRLNGAAQLGEYLHLTEDHSHNNTAAYFVGTKLLAMLCLSIFILQSTLTYTSVTLPHVTYYWKTTEDFDKVYDYWNHGPIYIPGLQNVFNVTTKALNVFPPRPTRSTTQSTEATEHATQENVTPLTTATTPVESSKTESQPTDKSKTIEETKETDKTTAKTEPIATTKTITTQSITQSEEDGTTDPFSVFLRKLFRSLSVKSLPEFPALVLPLVTYLEELANDQLKYLGDVIIQFVKKVARNIRTMVTTTPSVLHVRVHQIYNALSNRHTELDADVLDLLDVLDDTFDEAEEEYMQSTLYDVKGFPNSTKTGQQIARDLLDNIILAAIKRITGTSKGETLSLMVTDIIEKRKSDVRRNFKKLSGHLRAYDKASSDIDDIIRPSHRLNISTSKTHRKKKSVNYWHDKKTRTDASIKRYTQAIYQRVRNNLKDIRNLMGKVVISSSDTNEYELSIDSESEDQVRSAPEQTDNIHFRINKESQSSEYREFEELHKVSNKNRKKQGKHKVSSENVKHLNEQYSKSQSGYDDVGLGEWIKTEEDKNKKKTILVPQWSLLTKLIKDNVLEFDDSKKTHMDITSRTTYWKENKKKNLTKPMKTLSPGDGLMSQYIDNAISTKNKLTTKFSLSHLTNTYPLRYQSKLVSATVETKILNKNRRPDYPKIDKHLESTQLYTGKPVSQMKYTKDNNEMVSSRSTKQYFTKGKIKTLGVQNNDKNITERDDNNEEYILSIEGETAKESKDSKSDAECSSKDTGTLFQENQENIDNTVLSPLRHSQGGKKHQKHFRNHRHRLRHKKHRHKHGHKHSHCGKRKYEALKRKYKRLKELLAAQKVNYDHSRPEESKKHIDIVNMKQADMKVIYPKSFDISKNPAAEINYSLSEVTTPTMKGNLRENKINMFLDDYDAKAEITTKSDTIPYYGIFRKAFPPNTTIVFEANDSSDVEKELKENIHDTIRHMDFDNYNVSRGSYHDDNTSTVRVLESPETDVEAVLKSNIYKAVKKLLKK